MVVESAPPTSVPDAPSASAATVAPADAAAYVADMAGQLAAMCIAAGRPEEARALLRVQISLNRGQVSAAPGDAA